WAHDISVPVVSFTTAITSMSMSCRTKDKLDFTSLYLSQLTPRLRTAFRSSVTTSSPSTPAQQNPLVQLTSRALVSPSWRQGKLNVNPRGSLYCIRFRFSINFAIQSAMWSKSYYKKESKINGYNQTQISVPVLQCRP